ncbi:MULTISPECIES: hypothetical protein [Rhodococcus]|uniref:Uncharacterized protein n=1 Tax=Rhodococcus koreensis TaxID=99653 RepID=A0A1H4LSB5_9NOCA|nr:MULTISPECIES: hypothetical protein [Rhodococcus]QQZ19449.1 hypothetical protein GO592_40945 [Rhodococcus sp. 21391]SEB73155.1 hypothetical protein SAMN04490239_1425 [Rhodococcus koreensis]
MDGFWWGVVSVVGAVYLLGMVAAVGVMWRAERFFAPAAVTPRRAGCRAIWCHRTYAVAIAAVAWPLVLVRS